MDTIEDVELAFDWHLARLDRQVGEGERYLITYGLLQALVVQQDAVKHLGAVLDRALREHQETPPPDDAQPPGTDALQRLATRWNIPFERLKALKRIRRIRNSTAGHPTETNAGKNLQFGFIGRQTMSTGSYLLTTIVDPDDESRQENIDLVALIEDQRKILGPALLRMASALLRLAHKIDPG